MLVRGKISENILAVWGLNRQLFGYHWTSVLFNYKFFSPLFGICHKMSMWHFVSVWHYFPASCTPFIYFLHLSLFHHRCRLSPHTSTLLFASFPTCPQVFQGLLLLISSQSRPWSLRCPSCSSPCSPCVKTRKIWDPLHSHNRSEIIFLLLTFQPF